MHRGERQQERQQNAQAPFPKPVAYRGKILAAMAFGPSV
jgi:hypothetical protein